ncbi:MAG: hypothetical protein SFU98_04110 [Leptospiraceae bacterium]|nr:hypothetical protein [Leptospiraceae bacterium]
MKTELILNELNEYGKSLSFKSKTKILSPNLKEKFFFYIETGYLQQYYLIKGKKHVFRLIEPNTFCESFTILNGEVNNFEFIETVSAVNLIQYDYQKLIHIIDSNLEVSNFFRELLGDFLFFQEKRILKFLAMNPRERYEEFIRNDYQKIGKFSDNIIASYLGMTKESLSRFRNKKS